MSTVEQQLLNAMSVRSVTVEESPASLPLPSSTRPQTTTLPPSIRPITSERAAVEGRLATSSRRPLSRRPPAPPSISMSSASDLSVLKERSRHRHHRRRHRSRSTSSDSSRRKSHHSRKKRHHSRSRSSVSSKKSPSPPEQKTEENDQCGRCGKTRNIDPLDPAMTGLSAKKRERIRLEIIDRIRRLQRNNPKEDIRLPVRGLDDPVVCYRRYRRIARHLYAKRSIPTYQLMVFGFTLIVQVGMSIMFGPAAAEYLKREYEQIRKYDAIFYEMGCRAYSPNSESQSPEYRFALQLVTPILIIVIGYFIGRYTPVPPTAINLFTSMATEYLKTDQVTDFQTLLHYDACDEPDESSDEDEEEEKHPRRSREPRIEIPDLESGLPGENFGTAAIQAAVPSLVNMITSIRAQPEGSASPPPDQGMVGTIMNLAQAFMSNSKAPATVPEPAKPQPYTD